MTYMCFVGPKFRLQKKKKKRKGGNKESVFGEGEEKKNLDERRCLCDLQQDLNTP